MHKMKRRSGRFSLIEAVSGKMAVAARRRGARVVALGARRGSDSGMEEESWGRANLRSGTIGVSLPFIGLGAVGGDQSREEKRQPARCSLTINDYQKWGGEMKGAALIHWGKRRGFDSSLAP
jgi:hypothetical protein